MSPSKKRSINKRWLGGAFTFGCLSFVFCGLGGFFLIAKMFRDDSAKLPSNLDLARQRGLPLTPEDITRLTPPVRDSDNAAPFYREAIALNRKAFASGGPRLIDRSRDPNWREMVRRRNAAFQPVLRLVKLAVQRPECDFKDNLELGYRALLGDGKPFEEDIEFNRIGSGIFGMGLSELRRGDLDSAFDDISTLLLMAGQGPKYSSVFRGSWAVSADSLAMQLLFRVLLQHWREPGVLDKVETLAQSMKLPNLYHLLETEFVLGLEAIHHIKSLEEVGLDRNTPKAFSKVVDDLYQSPAVRQGFEGKYVKVYLDYFKALPSNPEDWPAIHHVTSDIRKELDSDTSVDIAIARMLTPAYPSVPLSYGSAQAQQRMIITSVCLLRMELESGAFPKVLPTFGFSSIDPLSGKPLHYRFEPDGFTLYSVGNNMKDDGGKYKFGPGSRGEDDIIYKFSMHSTIR